VVKALPASMLLDGSSDDEFKGFNIARRSPKDDVATL
jgi:hypothetical protein